MGKTGYSPLCSHALALAKRLVTLNTAFQLTFLFPWFLQFKDCSGFVLLKVTVLFLVSQSFRHFFFFFLQITWIIFSLCYVLRVVSVFLVGAWLHASYWKALLDDIHGKLYYSLIFFCYIYFLMCFLEVLIQGSVLTKASRKKCNKFLKINFPWT